MKFDQLKAKKWLHSVDHSLPGIESILNLSKSPVLILGAGALELFSEIGWIAPLRRGQTGDLDLSIGLVKSANEYAQFVSELKSRNYRLDDLHPYRWHSPKPIAGAMTYIDVLSHPTSSAITEGQARQQMGVGADFSLNGMNYAMTTGHRLSGNIIVPAFIGMLALKIYSYENNPDKRRKDLADVVEICWGLVERRNHLALSAEWAKVKAESESQYVKATLEKIISGKLSLWDLEEIENELFTRNFSRENIESTAQRRIEEIVAALV